MTGSCGPTTWPEHELVSDAVRTEVNDRMERAVRAAGLSCHGPVLARLLAIDPRLAFECAGVLYAGRHAEVEAYEAQADGGAAVTCPSYALDRFRWLRTNAAYSRGTGDLKIVEPSGGGDRALTADLAALARDVDGDVGSFIEAQLDVASVNALVRAGVVKRWTLPSGTEVVSKRDNPHKPGRFGNEVHVARIARERLAGRSHNLWRGSADGDVEILVPAATVVHTVGWTYSISRFVAAPTMEERLLVSSDPVERTQLLNDAGAILEALFEVGIWWNDMSPRNILVDREGPIHRYHLVDFEKSMVGPDRPASEQERQDFCRGQVGVEELGVICTPQEMAIVLRGAWDPAGWSMDDPRPLPFVPRPDLAAVIGGRVVPMPSLGEYNALDRAVLAVRLPRTSLDGRWWYPGHIGFRVEHYLSCLGDTRASDADRRTTEALLSADRDGLFVDVAAEIDRMSLDLEAAVVGDDLVRRAGIEAPAGRGAAAAEHLVRWLRHNSISKGLPATVDRLR